MDTQPVAVAERRGVDQTRGGELPGGVLEGDVGELVEAGEHRPARGSVEDREARQQAAGAVGQVRRRGRDLLGQLAGRGQRGAAEEDLVGQLAQQPGEVERATRSRTPASSSPSSGRVPASGPSAKNRDQRGPRPSGRAVARSSTRSWTRRRKACSIARLDDWSASWTSCTTTTTGPRSCCSPRAASSTEAASSVPSTRVTGTPSAARRSPSSAPGGAPGTASARTTTASAARSTAASTRAVLPMPPGPRTSARPALPARVRRRRSAIQPSSAVRPRTGVPRPAGAAATSAAARTTAARRVAGHAPTASGPPSGRVSTLMTSGPRPSSTACR